MDIGSPDTPRWIQRLQNFDRALVLLRRGIEIMDSPDHPLDPALTAIVREGTIQRFEYCFELGWKTLKDYLEFRKVTLPKRGPGDVLKIAFETGYISHGEDWLQALDARNEMSHVYRQDAFERVLIEIRRRFLTRLEELHEMLTLAQLEWSQTSSDAD